MREILDEKMTTVSRGDLARCIFDALPESVEILFDESITGLEEVSPPPALPVTLTDEP